MLKDAFFNVYTKFKLHFYQEIFSRFQDREASLTTVETFCMEAIQALGSPTVNEFATFMRISPPNAAYKVNSLIKKGYIRKVQSSDDRREYHLEITQKYIDYYNISTAYMTAVMNRITQRFTPAECAKLEEMLTIISRELMAEVEIPDALSGQSNYRSGTGCQPVPLPFQNSPSGMRISALGTFSQAKSSSRLSPLLGSAEGLKPARYASFPRISGAVYRSPSVSSPASAFRLLSRCPSLPRSSGKW